jgi:hypothetical protein
MCRIESPALARTESRWAARTQEHSEKQLIDTMERFSQQIIKRRGGDGSTFRFNEAAREEIRQNIRDIAGAHCAL